MPNKYSDKLKKAFPNNLKNLIHIPYLLVLAAVAIANFTKSEILTLAIFLALLIIFAKQKYDSRIPIGFALLLLVITAFVLAFSSEALANRIAIYSYYYLVVGVVLQLIGYIREKPRGKDLDETE